MFLQVSVCPQGVSQHALQVTCRSPPAKETPLPRRLPCQGDPPPRRPPCQGDTLCQGNPPQFFFAFFFTFFLCIFLHFVSFLHFFSFPSFSFFFLSFFNILNKLFHHLFTPPPPCQCAGGTHPTGMHSCWYLWSVRVNRM